MTIVFSNSSPKNAQIRQFWSQSQHETLHFGKFQGADFKYDNSFFSNYGLKVPKQGNFDLKLKVLLKLGWSRARDSQEGLNRESLAYEVVA